MIDAQSMEPEGNLSENAEEEGNSFPVGADVRIDTEAGTDTVKYGWLLFIGAVVIVAGIGILFVRTKTEKKE